ncbi:hypothetical protein HK097_001241 [Rhizophlyctis rosea]|uniref:Uncharacterized protein n=1 Tax=Rhizophlyctis rosea TaxID=64517 RepID=A0AAD5SJ52_9FUNG|nr:hypothetical protein HK097_001241 [Rhizophlyctis rosea]
MPPLRQTLRPYLRSPVPYLLLSTAALGFWYSTIVQSINSQKAHSGIFKAVMFYIRRDPRALSLLGANIKYDPETLGDVKGTVTMHRGTADLKWAVEGDNGVRANVHYRGARRTPQEDIWESDIFTVQTGDTTLSLKDE